MMIAGVFRLVQTGPCTNFTIQSRQQTDPNQLRPDKLIFENLVDDGISQWGENDHSHNVIY